MIKKFGLILVFLLTVLFLQKPVSAFSATLHFFKASGCPHCADEKVFLEKLQKKYPSLEIREYEIVSNYKNLELLNQVRMKLKISYTGVPLTVVGNQYIVGFLNEETTGAEIEKIVAAALYTNQEDLVVAESSKSIPEFIKFPVLGNLKVKDLSLPFLTFVIALLDGFNPCAMWTLLFLISMLLGMKNRTRMWILGSAFIAASAFVYFLFLAAWLNIFILLGLVKGIRISIGLFALAAGAYYLYDFWKNKSGSCKVSGGEKRKKVFEKIREIIQERRFILALGGIVVLAIVVNMLELVCSAGLPAIYTHILSMSDLSPVGYYSYLVLYVFIFMLDDLFVFFAAMFTLHAVGVESKYSRYSHLIGGIVVIIIGLLLIFKPELLMFGN